MNFEEWLKQEMDKLDKIRNALKERHGTVDRDYQEWLFEDAKEPRGFVQKGSVAHAPVNHINSNEERAANGSGKAAATDSGIVEIMAKRHLVDDNGKLKLREFLKPPDFAILARELEEHGYKYSKKAGGFLLEGKGVKS